MGEAGLRPHCCPFRGSCPQSPRGLDSSPVSTDSAGGVPAIPCCLPHGDQQEFPFQRGIDSGHGHTQGDSPGQGWVLC